LNPGGAAVFKIEPHQLAGQFRAIRQSILADPLGEIPDLNKLQRIGHWIASCF
jgi:hypothetical protein